MLAVLTLTAGAAGLLGGVATPRAPRCAVQRRSALSAVRMETSEIMMPALSSTMTEGKISQWLKSPGDKVEPGDMVLVLSLIHI
eukprot:2012676-Prymnesium_polylepis.1